MIFLTLKKRIFQVCPFFGKSVFFCPFFWPFQKNLHTWPTNFFLFFYFLCIFAIFLPFFWEIWAIFLHFFCKFRKFCADLRPRLSEDTKSRRNTFAHFCPFCWKIYTLGARNEDFFTPFYPFWQFVKNVPKNCRFLHFFDFFLKNCGIILRILNFKTTHDFQRLSV